jgi:hypothetical protein
MILQAAAAVPEVPWSGILGVIGTLLGTSIGAFAGYKTAKIQSNAETHRQAERARAASADENAHWLREKRVEGYMTFLRYIDRAVLKIRLSRRDNSADHPIPETLLEDVQDSISALSLYGPDEIRKRAELLDRALTHYKALTGSTVEADLVKMRSAYIAEARRQLGVEEPPGVS